MGQLGSVDLDFGISGFDKIAKAMSWMEDMGKKIKGSVGGIERPFKNMEETFNDNIEGLKEINKHFEDHRKGLRETERVMEGLGDNKILSFFNTLNSRILRFGQQAQIMQRVGGVTGLLKMQFYELGRTMQVAFGVGLKKQIVGIISVLGSILPWVVIIGGAIGLFFKIWENNIGNVQGLWIQLMGNIQRAWAQFDVQLRKALINLTPLLNSILRPIFSFVSGFVVGALEMFTDLLWVFGQVGKVLSPVIRFFSELFGIGNNVNNTFNTLGKTIGRLVVIGLSIMVLVKVVSAVVIVVKTLIAVWTILSAVFLASPIGWIVLAVMALIGVIILLVKHFDKVKEFFGKMVDFIMQGFNWIRDRISATPDWILALIYPMGLVIKHFDKIKEAFGKFVNFFIEGFHWLKERILGMPDWLLAITMPLMLIVKHFDKVKFAFKVLWDFIKLGISFWIDSFKMFFEAIRNPFDTIWDMIGKVMGAWDRVKGFFGGGKKEVEVEANVRPAQAGMGNNVNNTTSVVVHASGQLNEASAARIGESLSGGIRRNDMMG